MQLRPKVGGRLCNCSLSPARRPWANRPQTLPAAAGVHWLGARPRGAVPPSGSGIVRGHGGPQQPKRLISPSRPREWHLRPWLREEGATASGGVETCSGGAKRFQALGPGLTNEVPGAAVAPPLPPRDSWIGCWCGLSPATPPPQFEVPVSRPVCRPFWFSVDFFSTPSYN